MNIVLRCDSSFEIGSGHVIRDLTLAALLREQGHRCFFVCKDLPGHFANKIREAGCEFELMAPDLDQKADAQQCLKIAKRINATRFVVDNYYLDQRFEAELFSLGRTLVLDDLADRPHQCHALLDSNFHLKGESRYRGLVPADCRLYLGLKYALLRKEFVQVKATIKHQTPPQNIFCFFGGADLAGESLRLIKVLGQTTSKYTWQIVISSGSRFAKEILAEPRRPHIEVKTDPLQISHIMANSFLFVGSGGTITWERMYMGLGGFIVIVADNQKPAAFALQEAGLAWVYGEKEQVNYVDLVAKVEHFNKSDFDRLQVMAEQGAQMVSPLQYKTLKEILELE